MLPDTSASVRSLTQAVKAEAHRLGFHLVGVTTPDPPPHLAVFENWLSEGRHGEMAYLGEARARQRRADPRLILPECQSILVLGLPYPASLTGQNKGEGAAGRAPPRRGHARTPQRGPALDALPAVLRHAEPVAALRGGE